MLIDVELIVKATGQRIVEENEIHIWHFDGEARICRYAHKVGSQSCWLALREWVEGYSIRPLPGSA